MPICVLALKNSEAAQQFFQHLKEASSPLIRCELVEPIDLKEKQGSQKTVSEGDLLLTRLSFEDVPLLNSNLAKQIRQRSMARWLMPFGLIAGLSFTQMTGLKTFSGLGLGDWSEVAIGSLLGMFSGLIGSFFAAASVKAENSDEIESLRKLSKTGRWLLIIETPFGIDLPWNLIQEAKPERVMRISDS